jgi:hypothetical protein
MLHRRASLPFPPLHLSTHSRTFPFPALLAPSPRSASLPSTLFATLARRQSAQRSARPPSALPDAPPSRRNHITALLVLLHRVIAPPSPSALSSSERAHIARPRRPRRTSTTSRVILFWNPVPAVLPSTSRAYAPSTPVSQPRLPFLHRALLRHVLHQPLHVLEGGCLRGERPVRSLRDVHVHGGDEG